MNPEEEVAPHPPRLLRFELPLARAFLWVVFLFLGPIAAKGKYRIPKGGGLLILANHLSDVDPIVVQLACPRPIHFMAKSELFEMKVVGRILRWFKAFPVKRGEPDRASIRRAVALLKRGEVVCVFPEGELSESGELQELKPGVALIARMAQAQVICCGLRNTNRIMPYGKTTPRPSFHLTRVEWGEPRLFGKDTDTEEIVAWAEGQLRELTGQELY